MEVKIENKIINSRELVKTTINTENLAKMVEHLLNNDKNAFTQINDIKIRCSRLEEEIRKYEEMIFTLSSHERKINEIFSTIQSYNTRLLHYDSKFYEFGKVKIIFNITFKL